MQQNWIHTIFLLLGFLVTWAAWVLFGIFATVRAVVGDFCQNLRDGLEGRPGAQQILQCPNLAAAQASIATVRSLASG